MQPLRGLRGVRDQQVRLTGDLVQRLKLTRHQVNTLSLTERGGGDLIQQTAQIAHQTGDLLQILFHQGDGTGTVFDTLQ